MKGYEKHIRRIVFFILIFSIVSAVFDFSKIHEEKKRKTELTINAEAMAKKQEQPARPELFRELEFEVFEKYNVRLLSCKYIEEGLSFKISGRYSELAHFFNNQIAEVNCGDFGYKVSLIQEDEYILEFQQNNRIP